MNSGVPNSAARSRTSSPPTVSTPAARRAVCGQIAGCRALRSWGGLGGCSAGSTSAWRGPAGWATRLMTRSLLLVCGAGYACAYWACTYWACTYWACTGLTGLYLLGLYLLGLCLLRLYWRWRCSGAAVVAGPGRAVRRPAGLVRGWLHPAGGGDAQQPEAGREDRPRGAGQLQPGLDELPGRPRAAPR